ncbi:zf-HC2 domain-containing protein [bacterium]|jgi:anti-sigma factor (TIGR02949 family)|nr:zf-HC2 domain-containing protein [bacterium]
MNEKTEMLNCKEVIKKLYDFLADEITVEDVLKFKTHIEKCGHCNEVTLFHKKLKEIVKNSTKETASEELKRRILASFEK